MEDVTYTLYKVARCGFYDDEESHQFATLFQVLSDFRGWTEGLESIGESSTYTPVEDDDFLRAFCIDIKRFGATNHWMLCTWNELPAIDEGVQVVAIDSKIGSPSISAIEVDGVSLPGYPAFFFIDSNKGLVLNLRFEQRLNGSRQFQRYIQEFLRSSSRWCSWGDDDQLLGYEYDGDVYQEVEPYFRTTLRRVAANIDEIKARFDEIRKVIKRASVSPQVEQERAFVDSAFSIIGLPVNNRLRADIPFHIEMKARFTPEKLESVIEKAMDVADEGWDDVGFTFAKDSQKIHWLSGAIARKRASINVGRNEHGMIDLDDLSEFLQASGGAIIEALEGD
ncbi:hypothetical protein [Stenotrophomonas maltophilia]|uniref:hypothetical protein n=1 Tax=Stenotrophomonas maltophilia TaxID=40324 RepID=UPI0007F8F69F|nr:hypothetical protein [Stenotrophomonas maltophilia]OBU56111.1 hypothetical protein A9K70_17405 [Stenotrophomonas maltophilia]